MPFISAETAPVSIFFKGLSFSGAGTGRRGADQGRFQGITGTPQAATFTIGVILVLITLFIVLNIINSRTGRAIMAIRDNRIAG